MEELVAFLPSGSGWIRGMGVRLRGHGALGRRLGERALGQQKSPPKRAAWIVLPRAYTAPGPSKAS